MEIGTKNVKLFVKKRQKEDFMTSANKKYVTYEVDKNSRMMIRNIQNVDILAVRCEGFLRENNIQYRKEDGEYIPIGLFKIGENCYDYCRQDNGNMLYDKHLKLSYKDKDEYYDMVQVMKNIERAFMVKAEALELMDYEY